VTKLSCTCRKRINGRKEKKQNKTKQKKQKLDKRKVKRENRINIIIYTGIYLPWQRHQKLDTIKELISYLKCISVEVINNPARPVSNHREVNYIEL
jgi:hypothetical protein